MSAMMELLKKVDGLFITPVSDGADLQNKYLSDELPFKIYKFKSGIEHNGWIVPQKWEVIKAQIKKDGKLVYDGKSHPLGVIGSSESFRGRVNLEELKDHCFFSQDSEGDIVYHCDLYYKPFKKNWGFCMPYKLFKKLKKGIYEVDLVTKHTGGYMKVLEYTHRGKTGETIILNAHNCHAAQLNDGPSGYAVGIEVMKKLKLLKTRYTYKLIIAPEHLGTVFYTQKIAKKTLKYFKYCIFLEMLGNNWSNFALQESFWGNSELDLAAHHFLKFRNPNYWSAPYRKIVGNDESVWEAPGIEVPTITLSRCQSSKVFYPQYHLNTDDIKVINENRLDESVETVLGIIDVLEKNCRLRRKFSGLVALSSPKYNLYFRYIDPSINAEVTEVQLKWNYLMNRLPRYCDRELTILEIAKMHDLPFEQVWAYVDKFRQKDLVDFVYS